MEKEPQNHSTGHALKGNSLDSLHSLFEAFLFLCQSDAKIPFPGFAETIARRDNNALFK